MWALLQTRTEFLCQPEDDTQPRVDVVFPNTGNNNAGTPLGVLSYTALGVLSYSDRPTITFTPLSGEDLARTSIRPLLPADILPLAASGLPVDVLFRLSVQSVGTLQNTVPLAGPEIGATGEFFELIAALRGLQERGLLSLRFVREKQGNRVFVGIADGSDARSRALAERARRLLHIPARTPEFEAVYGRVTSGPNQVAMLTRPIFAALTQVGAEIEVPP